MAFFYFGGKTHQTTKYTLVILCFIVHNVNIVSNNCKDDLNYQLFSPKFHETETTEKLFSTFLIGHTTNPRGGKSL